MTVVEVNMIEAVDGAELERRFTARIGATAHAEGFLGAELLRPASGSIYFSIGRWASEEAFRAFAAAAAAADVRAGTWHSASTTGAELLSFEVVASAPQERKYPSK